MAVLRGNKDMMISVLESFIHDPLVEWSGKAKVTAYSASAAASDGAAPATAAGGEKENKDGLRMIKRISERLDGFYNAGIEAAVARAGWKSSRVLASATKKFGSTSLSIEGQVHRLIKEATSDENLALMYIGWMPFA